MSTALLLLGSNIEPDANLSAALQALRARFDVTVTAASAVYRTPAIGADGKPADQPAYHNMAVAVETALTAGQLRQLLRQIEAAQGRIRTEDKFAPRRLDIDIAFFDRLVTKVDGMEIPDPNVERYSHVAVPLAEIAPEWRHPLSGATLDQLAARLASPEMEIVRQ